MATLELVVPNDKANKVYDAFHRAYGHGVEAPTPQDKLEFVRSKLIEHIKQIVHADDVSQAVAAARPPRDESIVS